MRFLATFGKQFKKFISSKSVQSEVFFINLLNSLSSFIFCDFFIWPVFYFKILDYNNLEAWRRRRRRRRRRRETNWWWRSWGYGGDRSFILVVPSGRSSKLLNEKKIVQLILSLRKVTQSFIGQNFMYSLQRVFIFLKKSFPPPPSLKIFFLKFWVILF